MPTPWLVLTDCRGGTLDAIRFDIGEMTFFNKPPERHVGCPPAWRSLVCLSSRQATMMLHPLASLSQPAAPVLFRQYSRHFPR
jgi:hypothetical protein